MGAEGVRMVEAGGSPSCCCCIPIRVGVGILLGLDILRLAGQNYQQVNYLVNATTTSGFYKVDEATNKELSAPIVNTENASDIEWWITAVSAGLNALEIVFVILAFYAVVAVAPPFILPHLIASVIGTALFCAATIFNVLWLGLTINSLVVVIAASLILLLIFYFTWVTWLCYAYLKVLVMMDEAPNGYISHTPSSQMTNL